MSQEIARLENIVVGITEQMKRPMPFFERLSLNAERKDIREMIAKLKNEAK